MLVRPPEGTHTTFLGMPLLGDPAAVTADFAVIGVPFAVPYGMRQVHYGPADAPRAVRELSFRFGRMLEHYDFAEMAPLSGEARARRHTAHLRQLCMAAEKLADRIEGDLVRRDWSIAA